ncbi:hypothetical protein MDG893_13159 [Marinobacter algicola DG893]|uniref:Uncharacterized protein n=1 Tax=Marinobacter algicola DG893 TaxID=443152 RepID=A6F4C0_9GAMM|nr:hypothetical protein MDG893_13159 [Marinobacter algicola DG893]
MARRVKVIIPRQESNKIQARLGLTRAERRAKPIKAIGIRANSSSVESDKSINVLPLGGVDKNKVYLQAFAKRRNV